MDIRNRRSFTLHRGIDFDKCVDNIRERHGKQQGEQPADDMQHVAGGCMNLLQRIIRLAAGMQSERDHVHRHPRQSRRRHERKTAQNRGERKQCLNHDYVDRVGGGA